MAAIKSRAALNTLADLRLSVGSIAAHQVLVSLEVLDAGMLQSGEEVSRLHDLLCVMRAYPPNQEVLFTVEKMLSNFSNRKDLIRHHRALADTGIAGTSIYFEFYWQTAKWLFDNWPQAISIDWTNWEESDRLTELWQYLLSSHALEVLDNQYLSPRKWIELIKRPEESDAAFIVRLFARWQVDEGVRETTYDELNLPLKLTWDKGTPSRTHSKYVSASIQFNVGQNSHLPEVAKQIQFDPLSIRSKGVKEGRRLKNLARTQMITRARDLYGFMHADPRDVRLLRYSNGIQFVSYGLMPEKRSMLEAMTVFLILKNGVPIGYAQAASLLNSAEVNFNIFDIFRGTETSQIFIKTLSMIRYLFNSDAFIINTQQLGKDNREALESGAFWFYYKHGFRPRNAEVRKLAVAEFKRKKSEPGYRSSLSTLRKLAACDLHLFLGKPQADLVNTIPVHNIALMAAKTLEIHATTPLSNGSQECMSKAMNQLGYRPKTRLSKAQRIAWECWSPIVLALPNLTRWSETNKHALVQVINAKGGRSECKFVTLFDNHKRLKASILKLAQNEAG